MSTATKAPGLLARVTPGLFVLLWASGFIVAREVRPYAEPETFVSVRFALSAIVLTGIAFAGRARWPRTAKAWGASFVAGMLMQGAYVGGVFWSIKNGLSPAVAALIAGLQPLLTGALAGPLLDEKVSPMRWTGIVVGFVGAVLVLLPNLSGVAAVSPQAVAACLAGTAGITLGTIWQKRTGALVDLRSGAAIQFVGGLAIVLPLALMTEHGRVVHRVEIYLSLAYAVLVLSVATALLLLTLIRRGAVARVTSLFYLVPPITALMALVLFGEGLVPIQIVGMVVATLGVAIANRG